MASHLLFDHGREKKIPYPPWEGFLVLAPDRVVLGVYGSALRFEAMKQRAKIRQHRRGARILVVSRTLDKKPSVGDYIAPLLPGQETPEGFDPK